MTIGFMLCLSAMLAIALGAIVLLAHAIESRVRPDSRGSLWRHIFKE